MGHNEGAENQNARFTAGEIRRIRVKAAKDSSGETRDGAGNYVIGKLPFGWLTQMAKLYDTTPGAIKRIVSGQRWACVGGFKYERG